MAQSADIRLGESLGRERRVVQAVERRYRKGRGLYRVSKAMDGQSDSKVRTLWQGGSALAPNQVMGIRVSHNRATSRYG